jgi:hypothetical protein
MLCACMGGQRGGPAGSQEQRASRRSTHLVSDDARRKFESIDLGGSDGKLVHIDGELPVAATLRLP